MKNWDTQSPFSHFPADVQARVRGIMHEASFMAGEQIFSQGAPCTAVYLVVSGQVKVLRVTPEGSAIVLCVRGPGEYFCPVPVLDSGTQLGSAEALTDVTLLWAERAAFLALCRVTPDLLVAVQGDCLGEVRRLVSRLEMATFGSTKARLAVALLAESLRRQSGDTPPDTVHLTHQELGELVGSSRETVSRVLAQMEREGLVTLGRQRIIIRDREALKALSGQ